MWPQSTPDGDGFCDWRQSQSRKQCRGTRSRLGLSRSLSKRTLDFSSRLIKTTSGCLKPQLSFTSSWGFLRRSQASAPKLVSAILSVSTRSSGMQRHCKIESFASRLSFVFPTVVRYNIRSTADTDPPIYLVTETPRYVNSFVRGSDSLRNFCCLAHDSVCVISELWF